MSKRILLVEPPFYRLYESDFVLANYPLSLGYLAGSILADTDWGVQVYSADFAVIDRPFHLSHKFLAGQGFRNYLSALRDPSAPVWAEVARAIREYAPDVVGITAKSQNFISACNVARIAKEVAAEQGREIFVVLGGPHATLTGREVFRCPHLDAAVLGEGERTTVELLRALEAEPRGGAALAGVPGLLYRDGDSIAATAPRELLADLDALPFPHQAAPRVLRDHASFPVSAFMNVFATRGCPFHCVYCASRYLWTRKVRFRSPQNVVREMLALQELGVKRVHFDDDTFGTNKRHVHALCDAMIAGGVSVPWSCEIHVRLVDAAVVEKMRRAGCSLVFVGIESGSDEILRSIRKHTTIAQAHEACRIIKASGIKLYTFFMVGFPDETLETMGQTFEAMRTIGSDNLVYSIFTPYPGTESFDICRQRGLIGQDYDVGLYNHQSPENCFSSHIPREAFRRLAAEMEDFVDAYNSGATGKPLEPHAPDGQGGQGGGAGKEGGT